MAARLVGDPGSDLHQIPGMRKGAAKKLGKEMSFDGTCAAWTCDLLSRCQGNCTKTCKCLMKWGGCGGCCECSCGSAETEEAIFFPDDEDRTGLRVRRAGPGPSR
eukprot:symbB.v1.2.022120.t1/scaffold1949.1/size178169/3